MKTLKTLWIALFAIVTGGCSTAWPKGKINSKQKPAEPCIAERIDGGVKITCPTSEAIVYDGEQGNDGLTPTPEPAIPGPVGASGVDGKDGTSCVVQSDGLVKCGESTYQLPVATSEECQVFILPKE